MIEKVETKKNRIKNNNSLQRIILAKEEMNTDEWESSVMLKMKKHEAYKLEKKEKWNRW